MREQWGPVAGKQFGLVLTDTSMLRRPYYGSILAGIHHTAHTNDYHIRFLRFFAELRNPVLFNELVHEEEISGLLLMSLDQVLTSDQDRRLIEQICSRIQNIICIEWEWEGLPSISFNRAEAAYKATRHLVELGHQHIAYVGQEDNRVTGYRQACLENQLAVSTYFVAPRANMAAGHELASQVLAQSVRPTAVTAGCDEVAIGLLKAFHQQGVQVPEDIALASIDNIPMAAYTTPALTTVDVPQTDLGRLAVQMLINRAQQADMPLASMLLPTRLIVRDSSGSIQSPD
jgi:DNA-binding LacI/PurR family transcriptional regulator